ncbi:MAG: acetate--CoA ligase family protein [Alphaproteobacteria bacterium]|nr:acetate--CoA ligase family protein [Alphaproteobacteria bacterium]
MTIRIETLDAFFNPRSVAIVGASSNFAKIGGRPVHNMKIAGYGGRIYPVNPGAAEIQGLPAFPGIADIPGAVDMAVIVVPMPHVEAAVTACIEKGVKAAIVLSSGFAEISEEGAQAQRRLADLGTEGGLRIMGPNCMGVMNTGTGMIATFISAIGDRGPERGTISVAAQSGAFGGHCFTLARERGLGLNLWATMGNQCDVEFSDCLAYMAQDPGTSVVLGYMEGVQDAEKLVEALEIARAAKKPVVLMKVGRSEVGTAAAASHTASLTGSDAVFDALLRQYNVFRPHSIDEMFDVGYAFAGGLLPKSAKTGIVTVSGGVGVIMADAAEDAGLELPPLPEATQQRMKALVPFAGTRNPLDVTAQFINDATLMETMYGALLKEGDYASAVCFLAGVGLNPLMMKELEPSLDAVRRRFPDHLHMLAILTTPERRARLQAMGYLCYEDPSRAIHALGVLAWYAEALRRGPSAPPPDLPAGAPELNAGTAINEVEGKRILAAAGVPAVPERLAASAAEAAAAATAAGFPVVMKIVSADILHKSEIGGVILNVATKEAAGQAYRDLLARAAAHAPDARIDGVLVAPMVSGGVETIMGVVRDPVFGPVVMFGLGGIFVEVLKDVTFRIAPFGIDEAHRMIREVRGYPMLEGVRGAPPADEEALAGALARLSTFAAINADVLETIDINPFIVLPKGEGALAVDALISVLEAAGG